jgi:hypothetical protein
MEKVLNSMPGITPMGSLLMLQLKFLGLSNSNMF